MVPRVEGSSPFTHPIFFDPVAQSAEHLPFKQGVRGSNPRWITRINAVKTLSFAAFFYFHMTILLEKLISHFSFMSSKYRFLRFFAGVGCVTCCVTCAQERKGGRVPSLLLSAVPRNNRLRVNTLSVFMHSQMQMRARAVAHRAHRADAAGPRASRQKDRALRKMCSLRTYSSRRRDVSEIKVSPPP